MPAHYRDTVEAWRRFYPECQQRVWDRKHVSDLVARLPAPWREAYERLQRPVQRADFVRYAILREHGGIYSDLDCVPQNGALRQLLRRDEPNVLLATESVLPARLCRHIGATEPIRGGVAEEPVRVANYWFASTPRHPFWDHVLNALATRSHLAVRRDYDVLYTTGPALFSTVYDQRKAEDGVVRLLSLEQSSFIRHMCSGTWRTATPPVYHP